jgi:hypothetical protein
MGEVAQFPGPRDRQTVFDRLELTRILDLYGHRYASRCRGVQRLSQGRRTPRIPHRKAPSLAQQAGHVGAVWRGRSRFAARA